ncbi:tRNA-dihydrouridine(47) synthase [NAD(P)(+)]-like [Chenopodium quinoa]|uniref:tRNA-dihydrouridine(47) synthase [NAD(P)(+)]-like n=1 Tax=Chenopodium quinoa TaxID=63459 RepID=UPI000B796124|nr:tRNA-dihydrouridine(47) synthase [NAD(P)(+)]-like [Chenopodium quinoa]
MDESQTEPANSQTTHPLELSPTSMDESQTKPASTELTQSAMDESEPEVTNTENNEPPSEPETATGTQPSPEELMAKGVAPVKKEFLRPPPTSRCVTSDENGKSDKSKSSGVVVEKKSKRQLKRERHEKLKSALNLCPAIARTGDISSCNYGDKCRFSHDLEAYKIERPADLEGECPFIYAQKPCPYGVTCRFYGTHKDVLNDNLDALKEDSEVNMLKKDVQKLLWKNKIKFPKSNVALKQLGVEGRGHTRVKDSEEEESIAPKVSNGSHCSEDKGCEKYDSADTQDPSAVLPEEPLDDGILGSDDKRPLKKSKSGDDERDSSNDLNNGSSVSGEGLVKDSTEDKPPSTNNCLPLEADASLKLLPRERKLIDFRGKLYLAPLTTVGNLPFRRVCKDFGADVTCGEMAMCTNLLEGQASEWALLRRHKSEDLFGVQICGAYPDTVARAVELIDQECSLDFIDINMGCPIDLVVNKGAGSALLTKPLRMKNVIQAACASAERPITVKVRTGYVEGRNRADSLISQIYEWGASALTIHGRSRQQRYSKAADWDYINTCVSKAPSTFQVLGNGDVFSYTDWNKHFSDCPELSSCMIARGALVKPWLFTEIKEQRHWDISSGERLDILRDYVRFGLEHWGSDSKGVETTRFFLLQWLSYTFRYIPVGLLDVIPQKINWRPPSYYGRNDLETLMASESAADWIRISEMLLGKVPPDFKFAPKHKSNAYDSTENG